MNTINRSVSPSIWKNNFFLIGIFLSTVATPYFFIYDSVAEGWLSFNQCLTLIPLYALFCFGLAFSGDREKPSMTKLRVQILIMSTGLAITAILDPGPSMPLVLLLAILPMEYSIRYDKKALQQALIGTFASTLLVIVIRYSLMTPGLTGEAIFTLFLFWAFMGYLYLTVNARNRLQEKYDPQ